MLTEAERHEIDEELSRYPSRQAACVDALKIVQRHRGWVSDEALAGVAEHLGMSAHELDAVATFYNLIYRRPVGRHVVLLCDSVSCWMTGADGLRMHLEQRYGVTLGTTSTDGRLTVLPIVCLGACDRAPVMMVDDDLHGEMTPDALDHALERYA